MELSEADPKGLVRESYLIEGITAGECRSILLDWALSLPVGAQTRPPLERLIAEYAVAAPDHPMSVEMHHGLAAPTTPFRRGGRAGRMAG